MSFIRAILIRTIFHFLWTILPANAAPTCEQIQVSKYRLSAELSGVNANRQNSGEAAVEAAANSSCQEEFRISYSRLIRNFSGSTQISDTQFGIGNTAFLSKTFSLNVFGTFSPDSEFIPQWSGAVEPHWLLKDDSDVSLLIQYNKYINVSAPAFRLQWEKPLESSQLNLGLNGGVTVSSAVIPSLMSFVQKEWGPLFNMRLELAGGKALEEPEKIGRFVNVILTGQYWVLPTRSLRVSVNRYFGQLRTENRLTFGFDLRF